MQVLNGSQLRYAAPTRPAATPATSVPAAACESSATPDDSCEVRFDGHRPAHRNVKKLARTAAGLVGAAGLGKCAFDLMTSPTLETGLVKAALSLAATAGAVVAVDVASGLGHHYGDNYGLPRPQSLDHTKWHADADQSGYCLVGLSNGALDKVGFWPAWESLIYKTTGKEPVSWQVPAYKDYALGKIDKATLEATLHRCGLAEGN